MFLKRSEDEKNHHPVVLATRSAPLNKVIKLEQVKQSYLESNERISGLNKEQLILACVRTHQQNMLKHLTTSLKVPNKIVFLKWNLLTKLFSKCL